MRRWIRPRRGRCGSSWLRAHCVTRTRTHSGVATPRASFPPSSVTKVLCAPGVCAAEARPGVACGFPGCVQSKHVQQQPRVVHSLPSFLRDPCGWRPTGGGIVESIGDGVTSVAVGLYFVPTPLYPSPHPSFPAAFSLSFSMVSLSGRARVFAGDHVIPLYTPECRSCAFCMVRRHERETEAFRRTRDRWSEGVREGGLGWGQGHDSAGAVVACAPCLSRAHASNPPPPRTPQSPTPTRSSRSADILSP